MVTSRIGAGSAGSAVEQLTAFVHGLANPDDPDAVVVGALARAAATLRADIAGLVVDDTVVAAVGVPPDALEELRAAADNRRTTAVLPGVGACALALGDLDFAGEPWLIVVRAGEPEFSAEETGLVRGMSRALALHLNAARDLAAERFLRPRWTPTRSRTPSCLRLCKNARRCSSGSPRFSGRSTVARRSRRVLESIVSGASELLGDDIVGLRGIDPADPEYAVILYGIGIADNPLLGEPIRIGEGAGGRAISENQLVVIHDYFTSDRATNLRCSLKPSGRRPRPMQSLAGCSKYLRSRCS